MALRKVVGRKKFKIFRGYMLLGYGVNLFWNADIQNIEKVQ